MAMQCSRTKSAEPIWGGGLMVMQTDTHEHQDQKDKDII